MPARILARSLAGDFADGSGAANPCGDFHVFHRFDANEPSADKADWVVKHLLQSTGTARSPAERAELARAVFRPDIYHDAVGEDSSTKESAPAQDISLASVST